MTLLSRRLVYLEPSPAKCCEHLFFPLRVPGFRGYEDLNSVVGAWFFPPVSKMNSLK
jgi:hypothetical protein